MVAIKSQKPSASRKFAEIRGKYVKYSIIRITSHICVIIGLCKCYVKNILFRNLFLETLEKSSEADVDFEELKEDLLTPTDESPIVISADDAPRSTASTSMKSLSLKCECHLRNDRKYKSAIQKGRYTETDYGSSSEMESTGRLFE